MTEPRLVAAPEALAAFAVITRPDLDEDDVRKAIAACQTVNWPWNKTLIQTSLMLAHLEHPHVLKDATVTPSFGNKNIRF